MARPPQNPNRRQSHEHRTAVKENKVETIFTDIGKVIQAAENVIINVGVTDANILTQFLPPSISGPVNQAIALAASTFAAMEATEQAIGASSVPYAQKAATIVALQGANIAKILAEAGLDDSSSAVSTIVTVATGVANLNFATITDAPAEPATPAA